MGLTTLPTPLHRVVLDCELVRGEVSVGVRAALPVDGIHFILGNGLAGGRVWSADPFLLRAAGSLVGDSGVCVTASPVVALCPSVQGGGLSPPPRVFPACADMRAMCAASLDAVAVREDVALSVADFPLEVSHEELAFVALLIMFVCRCSWSIRRGVYKTRLQSAWVLLSLLRSQAGPAPLHLAFVFGLVLHHTTLPALYLYTQPSTP
ncbi:uncharacterized protein LOC121656297 [Melanotaenia boesemani]|uniref:uncharacterized protein LOC121656297 n=1 Tax=Melanotaenia boesemani TaxID=1250792 RepID=UPI001C04899E|nr:uncharacterized protein LOC121656297 [Melanotaenia boesemani]